MATRLNIAISAIGLGIGAGLALFAGTHLSLAITGDQAGRYLNLLGVFMPGYSATPRGALIGLLWGVVYGSSFGTLMAWAYARSLGPTVVDMVAFDEDAARELRPPILLVDGRALGVALGLVAAIQLALTTSWLVLRGTAAESTHAQLLSNYLPGYTVTLWGAVVGACELFVLSFVASLILGWVYNFLVRIRSNT